MSFVDAKTGDAAPGDFGPAGCADVRQFLQAACASYQADVAQWQGDMFVVLFDAARQAAEACDRATDLALCISEEFAGCAASSGATLSPRWALRWEMLRLMQPSAGEGDALATGPGVRHAALLSRTASTVDVQVGRAVYERLGDSYVADSRGRFLAGSIGDIEIFTIGHERV